MTDDADEDSWENYESGPYCPHWSDPSGCDELCKCGHTCMDHGGCADDECEVCGCERFVDAEETA